MSLLLLYVNNHHITLLSRAPPPVSLRLRGGRVDVCTSLVNKCPTVFDLDEDLDPSTPQYGAEQFCTDQSAFFARSFVGAQSGMCGYERSRTKDVVLGEGPTAVLAAQEGGAFANAATETKTPWYAHYSFVAPMAVVGGVLIGVMAATLVAKKMAGARKAVATPESAGGNGDAIQISPEQVNPDLSSTDTKLAFANEAASFVITNNPGSTRKLTREARHEAIKSHNRENSRSMSTAEETEDRSSRSMSTV